MELADLELAISRRSGERYGVALRLTPAGGASQAQVYLGAAERGAALDPAALSKLEGEPAAYGHALTEQLFAAPELREAFAQARGAAAAPLRLRLAIGAEADELHALRWELLHDPRGGQALASDPAVIFSRSLSAADWPPLRLRSQRGLRTLALVAGPRDLERYGLAPVDAALEGRLIGDAFSSAAPTILAEPGQATLAALAQGLREAYDILYLAAHTLEIDGTQALLLSGEGDASQRVGLSELAELLRGQGAPPRLIILATPAAGGRRAAGSPLLGVPELLAAGVPAALVLDARLSPELRGQFLRRFVDELGADGQVDRAAAAAHQSLGERAGWWAPALFSRVRDGRLWYTPGFSDSDSGADPMAVMTSRISGGQAMAVLGPGLTEPLFGSQSELARRWAEEYNAPLSPTQSASLPDVAQYLAVNQDPQFPRDALARWMRSELTRRWPDLPAGRTKSQALAPLIAAAGAALRERDPDEPHALLARLPLPCYLTINPDNLLEEALRAAGREPVVELCRWNPALEDQPSIFEQEPAYAPTPERPLVFHLFGVIDEPDSLVLTDDDYNEFLIALIRNADLIPAPVRAYLADRGALWLGIDSEGLAFRTLRRALSGEGTRRERRYPDVIQIEVPADTAGIERRREYVESTLLGSGFTVYWGSPRDFGAELARELEAPQQTPARKGVKASPYAAAAPEQQEAPPPKASPYATQEAAPPELTQQVVQQEALPPEASPYAPQEAAPPELTQQVVQQEAPPPEASPYATQEAPPLEASPYAPQEAAPPELTQQVVQQEAPPELAQQVVQQEAPPELTQQVVQQEASPPELTQQVVQQEAPPELTQQGAAPGAAEPPAPEVPSAPEPAATADANATAPELEPAAAPAAVEAAEAAAPEAELPAGRETEPARQPARRPAPRAAQPAPDGQPPAEEAAATVVNVVVHALEERYQPPERTLTVEVREADVLVRYERGTYRGPNRIDDVALTTAALSPRRYGEQLFAGIFHAEPLAGKRNPTLAGYDRARADTGGPLRVQIALDHANPHLQAYRWEQLCDPRRPEDPPIAAVERTPLYRRIESDEALPAELAAEARPLKILVAICAPPGLGRPETANRILAELSPIDAAAQAKIADEALARLQAAGVADYQVLGRPGEPPATLAALREALEGGGYHVLHLLAHGVTIQGRYYVVMENDTPRPFVGADDLSGAIARQGVRLAVLAPCQSGVASAPGREPPSSLAATLVRRGVPAVIAMQDLAAISAVQFFTHHFYDDLARSGRVDMALAATRAALHQWVGDEQPDWGVPSLAMSGEDGRLFAVDEAGAQARLLRETPTLSAPDPVSASAGSADRLLRLVAQHAPEVGPAQIAALRSLLGPGAPAAATMALAREQSRDRLNALRRPVRCTAAELRAFVEGPHGSGLQLPPALYSQVAAALNVGKHLILIGPPGTGKTSLAHDICRYAAHPDRHFTHEAVMTTASADWTTFDTVGGYVPAPQGLQFRPGIFLRAICDGHWLVIDEINRAEIDKAFGELFTILSGQAVDLPYWVGEHQVRVMPALRERDQARPWVPPGARGPFDYVVHPNWRIIGAMNVYDRSSLFAMSFAFMRRFAFIDLDVPAPAVYAQRLLPAWLDGSALPAASRAELGDLIGGLLATPLLMRRRALGPAIIKDMVLHICECFDPADPGGLAGLTAEAITLYAVPQLDALDQESICAIYGELRALIPAAPAADAMLARIRLLYPHIGDDVWPT